MNNLYPIDIADKIKELSGINVFRNTRERKVVEHRALLSYILRHNLKMRWTNIALFYENNGKRMTHATVMNSCKQYPEYKRINKKLKEVQDTFTFKDNLNYDQIDRVHYLENKCNSCETKLNEPLVKLVRDIPKDRTTDVEENIKRLIKAWEWK
jgi:hypothetical protein